MKNTLATVVLPQIDDYLRDEGSPLAGQGEAFVNSGRTHNVDPRLLVAIASAETTFGLNTCAEYNAWNWFYVDTSQCSKNSFSSWAEGIERVAAGLRRLYLNQGRTTIPQIVEIYTTTERDIWIANVPLFYHDELGGDLSDLTFSGNGGPTATPTVIPTLTSEPTPEARGQILFVSNRDGDAEVYLINADGTGEARLTDNAYDDIDPAWLPGS